MILYITGCILAYGRWTAVDYGIIEKYFNTGRRPSHSYLIILSLLSWIGLAAGVFNYFLFRHKYFIKWSLGPLQKKWDEQNA